MKNITVLGAGLVGKTIVDDLAQEKEFKIKVVDYDNKNLKKFDSVTNIETVQINLLDDDNVKTVIKNSDMVVSAVPGFMGYNVLHNVIEAGKDIVDISFFEEDPFIVDSLAKKNGVTAVVDCGLAPGISNIVPGYISTQFDNIDNYICYVGGLPFTKVEPFNYKALYSPSDVFEFYKRPARLVVNGKEKIYQPLSEVETLCLPTPNGEILEAFNTDGLRTLIKTMKIPNMKEKTLRYPGHAALINLLKECGVFEKEETLDLFTKYWNIDSNDFTIMQIIIEGTKDEKKQKYIFDLYDKSRNYKETGETSMSRTTGFTCTTVVHLVLSGRFKQKGICPPEFIGKTSNCFKEIVDRLVSKGITIIDSLKEVG